MIGNLRTGSHTLGIDKLQNESGEVFHEFFVKFLLSKQLNLVKKCMLLAHLIRIPNQNSHDINEMIQTKLIHQKTSPRPPSDVFGRNCIVQHVKLLALAVQATLRGMEDVQEFSALAVKGLNLSNEIG